MIVEFNSQQRTVAFALRQSPKFFDSNLRKKLSAFNYTAGLKTTPEGDQPPQMIIENRHSLAIKKNILAFWTDNAETLRSHQTVNSAFVWNAE